MSGAYAAPIQLVPGAFSGFKRPDRESNHFRRSSTYIKDKLHQNYPLFPRALFYL
jgi:hypothetical protein